MYRLENHDGLALSSVTDQLLPPKSVQKTRRTNFIARFCYDPSSMILEFLKL